MKAKLVFLSLVTCWAVAHIPTLALSSKPYEKATHKLSARQAAVEVEAAHTSEMVRKVGKPYSKERYRDASSIVKVQAHNLSGQPAATLYVREVPVFTFVAVDENLVQPLSRESARDQSAKGAVKLPSAEAIAAPLSRATQAAAQLNQFYEQESNAAKDIIPVWDEAQQNFVVKLGENRLLALDNTTFLSDSSQSAEIDIRRSVNRLRRLMGEDPMGVESAEASWVEEVSAADISKLRSPAALSPQDPLQDLSSQVGRFFGEGLASWYGPGFHGRLTANGEVYDQNAMTAAHKQLPFGTLVRVVNLDNGRSTVVRINDRGPYIPGREIDLSAAAAQTLGSVQSGVAPVRMEILD